MNFGGAAGLVAVHTRATIAYERRRRGCMAACSVVLTRCGSVRLETCRLLSTSSYATAGEATAIICAAALRYRACKQHKAAC